MILSFTAIDQQGKWHQFFSELGPLEDAMDFLQAVIDLGDTIVNASLIDEYGSVQLSLDALDGQPFAPFIQLLQREWETLLNVPHTEPVQASLQAGELIQRLQSIKQSHVDHLTEVVQQMEALLQSTQDLMREGPNKNKLISRYQSNLNRYKGSLTKAKAFLNKI